MLFPYTITNEILNENLLREKIKNSYSRIRYYQCNVRQELLMALQQTAELLKIDQNSLWQRLKKLLIEYNILPNQ
ncbi:phage antirepressor YoqD-like protein [Niabella hirudinis]